MPSELSAKSLFNSYIKALKEQTDDITINKLTHDLHLRDWNLYFFSKHGIDKGYDVYCNKFNRYKRITNDLGDHFFGKEFLWDLCWCQREEKVKKRGDFLELVLEQECSQDFNDESDDAFWDFTKIVFACVKSTRVFIGRSGKRRFEEVSKMCADYYAKANCCKQNKGLLLILINQTSSGDTTICGWELTQAGEAKLLTEPVHFQYSGWF